MKKQIGRYKAIGYAVIVGLIMNHSQVGHAGWEAAMNGVGFGYASVNVKSSSGFTGRTATPLMDEPSAAMAPSPDEYFANADLPLDASDATVARIKGFAGYVYQAVTFGSDGDKTDSDEIDKRVIIRPSDCASLTIASSISSSNGNSGTISVDAIGTTGTALLLLGIECVDCPLPPDDTNTVVNESLEFLKTNANSVVKWDILLVGPFDLTRANCNAIVIPFTGGGSNLYFFTGGEAKSNPFTITCQTNVVLTCTNAAYPLPEVSGGCGNVTVTYSPPASSLSNGVPTPVTVIATDGRTNTATCTFTATRSTLTFDGFFEPIGGTGGFCPSTPNGPGPLRTVNRGSVIPLKWTVACGGLPVTTGTATLDITKCGDPSFHQTAAAEFTQNVWHANWDTTGIPRGIYILTVTLQDGSQQSVVVKVK